MMCATLQRCSDTVFSLLIPIPILVLWVSADTEYQSDTSMLLKTLLFQAFFFFVAFFATLASVFNTRSLRGRTTLASVSSRPRLRGGVTKRKLTSKKKRHFFAFLCVHFFAFFPPSFLPFCRLFSLFFFLFLPFFTFLIKNITLHLHDCDMIIIVVRSDSS